MQEYKIETKKYIIKFYDKEAYSVYLDFINNGLKVVRKAYNTYHFNDGSRFLDVPAMNGLKAVRVLTDRHNKQFRNERYFKKYLQAIAVYNK